MIDTNCSVLRHSERHSGLSTAQELALSKLLVGGSISAAAKLAGRDRATVHRWLHDEDFREEFEKRRQELRASIRDRLFGMAHSAADAVHSALETGDAKTALALLKGLGMLKDEPAVQINVPTNTLREPLSREDTEKELRRVLSNLGIELAGDFRLPSRTIPIRVVEEDE